MADAPAQREVQLANPRGFCAGVDRAIQIVERALEIHGAPVYVLHEIVHNKHVLETLRAKGTVFVKDLDEVPEGSVTVFSAHGVSDAVVARASERRLEVIDATCPLVTKVHRQAIRYEAQGREVVLVGHPGRRSPAAASGKVHVVPDVEAVAALEIADPDALSYVTQTTLSVDDTRDVIAALSASRRSRGPTSRTSATRPPIARRPSRTCSRASTPSSSSARRTRPTRAASRSSRARTFPRSSSITPISSTPSG